MEGRRAMIRGTAFAIALLACMYPHLAQAQSSVYGTVTTPQHEPVAGAAVLIESGAVDVHAITDRSGAFRFEGRSDGTYRIVVEAAGYEPLRESGLKIVAGKAVSIVLRPRTASSLAVVASVTANTAAGVSTVLGTVKRVSRSQLQEQSSGKLSDILVDEAALAPVRPAGGGSAAPFSVALRGPDPTETLVAIDGHTINTGATGTFDLSLIDPAILDEVELIYGIAPTSLVGPDTIGGSVNVRTMEPTTLPRALLRASYGSYDSTAAIAEATGTANGLGYVAAVDSYATAGDVRAFGTGSATAAENTLAKVRAPILRGAGFAQLTILDQNANRDISSALSSIAPDGSFTSFAGSQQQSHDSLLGVDVKLPAGNTASDGIPNGTLTARISREHDVQSVSGPGSNISQTFFNYAQISDEGLLQYDRATRSGLLTFQYSDRSNALTAPFTGGGVTDNAYRRRPLSDTGAPLGTVFQTGDTQRVAAVRYRVDPTVRLHYSAAVYDSEYSSFGRSVDPRFAFVWTPTRRTSVGASIGSTFQAPRLTELYVPSPLPPIDANGPDGIVSIGNAQLRPDRATEYALKFEHVFGDDARAMRISADLYQSNLRDTIVQYVPAARPAYSYPINVGDAVYRGAELSAIAGIGRNYQVTAEYVINSAFAKTLPPTAGGSSLVPLQQFEGTPLHRASLQISRIPTAGGLSYIAWMTYEGANNELNRPPFAVTGARLATRAKGFEFELSGTNLFNTYADRFTLAQRGVPYPGIDGPIATDAYSLPARTLAFTISKHI